MTTNILITGTKAGVGNGLLAAYATRLNTTVIAAIRDARDSDTAKTMVQAVKNIAEGSSIIPVRYDAAQQTSAQDLISYLHNNHPNIQHLDLVIANAGIATHWESCTEVTAERLKEHYTVNTIGPILLYQATRDLLLASQNPKLFVISSVVGSVQVGPSVGFQLPAYGTSKAAINWFARKANLEEEKIVLAAVSPGWVQTEMGDRAAVFLKQEAAPMTLEQSVTGLMKIFDGTGKKESKGLFLHAPGEPLAW